MEEQYITKEELNEFKDWLDSTMGQHVRENSQDIEELREIIISELEKLNTGDDTNEEKNKESRGLLGMSGLYENLKRRLNQDDQTEKTESEAAENLKIYVASDEEGFEIRAVEEDTGNIFKFDYDRSQQYIKNYVNDNLIMESEVEIKPQIRGFDRPLTAEELKKVAEYLEQGHELPEHLDSQIIDQIVRGEYDRENDREHDDR